MITILQRCALFLPLLALTGCDSSDATKQVTVTSQVSVTEQKATAPKPQNSPVAIQGWLKPGSPDLEFVEVPVNVALEEFNSSGEAKIVATTTTKASYETVFWLTMFWSTTPVNWMKMQSTLFEWKQSEERTSCGATISFSQG
ncbi:hypothetical protein [Vibrio ouci]|uniref:hypothetical protein n=1 Tax=Vibrio ouci TaxID=2499078 RepID=UPI001FCA248F|nr:hypothetical protein [Vibrio ouci]